MITEKSDVYSISGLFVERHSLSQAKFFGGFFSVRTNVNEQRQNVLAMPFNGSLVDCYGMSEIVGEISPAELRFNKRYTRNEDQIQYHFRKNENGVWVGEYSANERIGTGYTVAKINLDWKGVDMIVPRHFDPEGWTKDLLEQMVNNGMLEIVKDGKTGEEVVVPRRSF